MRVINCISTAASCIAGFGICACSDGAFIDGRQDTRQQSVVGGAIGDLAPGVEVTALLATDTRETRAGAITFVKYLNEHGDLRMEARDSNGVAVAIDEAEEVVSAKDARVIQPALANALASIRDARERLPVTIVLRLPDVDFLQVQEVGEADTATGVVVIDDDEVDAKRLDELNLARDARVHARNLARDATRASILAELAQRERWALSADDTRRLAEGAAVDVDLEAGQVERVAQANRDLILSMDLRETMEDGNFASAMVATWVDVPGSPNQGAHYMAGHDGAGVGVYQTESSCAANGAFGWTNYEKLSGSGGCADTCPHAKNVLTIARTVAPAAHYYCYSPATIPTTTQLAGTTGNPRIRITNMSAGGTSSGYVQSAALWDDFVYYNNILSVAAAGNDGDATSGLVRTPALALNLTGVGNYDDGVAPDTIHLTSSYEDPPDTRNEKPELSAPGTSINAGTVNGVPIVLTGTSMASPHVAGIAANLMSAWSFLRGRPWTAKAFLLRGAGDVIAGARGNVTDVDEVGVGGIDYLWSSTITSSHWWEGSNSDIAAWDAADVVPGNGSLDRTVTLQSSYSRVRVAIAWLNRGAWTLANETATYPMGMDFDLVVLKPNGTFQASSVSFDNPYELVEFDPAVTGQYRIVITRAANRDLQSGVYLGLAVGHQ